MKYSLYGSVDSLTTYYIIVADNTFNNIVILTAGESQQSSRKTIYLLVGLGIIYINGGQPRI